MTLASIPRQTEDSLGDLLQRLGDISPFRVRMHPAPGTAVEADAVRARSDGHRLYELVESTLVQKAVGYKKSIVAGATLAALRAFVVPRKLGHVSGPDGMLRLSPGLVRGPDVAFVSRDRLPDARVPDQPIPNLVPNLAVEVLSESNTPREMDRKRREYFEAGVELLWIVDPQRGSSTSIRRRMLH